MNAAVESLKNGLIVSCQALEGNPLKGSIYMAAMAAAAEKGGAAGIRANGPDDITAIRKLVSIPIIGINKTAPSKEEVYITPTFEKAAEVAAAGADIIALDATQRKRPGGITLKELIDRIKNELQSPVMADISTYEEGIAAAEAGADIVATTLSGYTTYSQLQQGPDFKLVEKLSAKLSVPVIAEGRLLSPDHLKEVFRLGAFAAVIGKIITNPMFITKQYVGAIEESNNG